MFEMLLVDTWLVPLAGPHKCEILWFNDIYGPEIARPPGISMPDVWHKISVKGKVPPNAVSLDLRGILLITRGAKDPTLPDALLWFAGTEQPGPDDYVLQVISANAGQRETGSVIVPLDDEQCFWFKWSRTGHGVYDAGPAYGLRMWAQAVGVVADAEGTLEFGWPIVIPPFARTVGGDPVT